MVRLLRRDQSSARGKMLYSQEVGAEGKSALP
jgi:hypothetical protein